MKEESGGSCSARCSGHTAVDVSKHSLDEPGSSSESEMVWNASCKQLGSVTPNVLLLQLQKIVLHRVMINCNDASCDFIRTT